MALVEMTSFDDLIARFAAHQLTARGRSRSTVAAYARDLEQFAELASVRSTKEFNRQAVTRWLNALTRLELSPRSRARKLSALRSLVRWGIDYGMLKENPVPQEVSAPRSLYLPHALSESETLRMIEQAAGEHPEALRDSAILETLYATGMRVSELTGLRLLDLHLGEGFAVVTGKGNKQRIVPLGQPAIDALRRYIDDARALICTRAMASDHVFLTRRGPMSRETVFRLVKRCAHAAGIVAKVSPHTFRHSCASHMLARGADLRLVQELLGHSALSTTQVYTHIEKSRMRAIYEQAHPLGRL